MDTTEVGTYAMIALTIGLIVFIWRMRINNIANSQDDPAIAGQGQLAPLRGEQTQTRFGNQQHRARKEAVKGGEKAEKVSVLEVPPNTFQQ